MGGLDFKWILAIPWNGSVVVWFCGMEVKNGVVLFCGMEAINALVNFVYLRLVLTFG